VSHYDVLGVVPAADAATVRQAYVTLARRHHPDRPGGDAARMRAVNDAWAVLGDPIRRADYDRALAGPAPAAAPASPHDGGQGATEDDDLLDDRPLSGGMVRLPRWLSLIPVALFCWAVGAVVVGLVMASPGLFGLGVVAFLLSCLFFLAAPFIALFAARTGVGGDRARR
jgi:hypothetical protein